MTAEIAILSKSAVVLAADSAVTITHGASQKIYNAANKIFEISERNHIGLMVFNSMEYMGLPLEVLAKEFRSKRADRDYKTVSECKDDFFTFLRSGVRSSEVDEERNFESFAFSILDRVNRNFQAGIAVDIREQSKVLKSRFNGILKTAIEADLKVVKGLDKADGYGTVRFSEPQKVIIDGLSDEVFRSVAINQTCRRLLHRLIALTIERKVISDNFTGMVFAGFGDDELCPSLIHCEIDGVLNGRLKIVSRRDVDIGRNGVPAEVLGFAQDDMVQSFVNGVDPRYRQLEAKLLREAIEHSARLVLEPHAPDEAALGGALEAMSGQFDALRDGLIKKADEWVDQNFTQDVKDMVRFMPKEDLATLAESLIDITSLKRKVTRKSETVGGEVDVAVISRSEGLIWVKRKHYFPAELNQRFFTRRGKV